MKTSAFLRQHDACLDGAKWAMSVSKDMADVWDAMIEQKKHDWLLWTATRPGVFPGAALRKMACRIVRETPLMDGRTVWDLLTDDRSRHAVEVAEAYADGKATDEELNSARSAARAAYAAARAERAACFAAHAAAYDAAGAASYSAHAAAYAAYAAYATQDTANAAANAANAAYDSALAAAESAQSKMIAELGNPFKKEKNSD